MMKYKCTPVSKNRLKNLALEFRQKFGINELFFPVLDILDNLHCDGLLNLEIVEDVDKRLSENELALYSLNSNTMFVKLSVYEEALNDVGRARFTLTHELSHYLLLKVLGFETISCDGEIKPYEDPEWQANYLAGELLAPDSLTEGFDVLNYINKCCLSEECAIVLWDKRRK